MSAQCLAPIPASRQLRLPMSHNRYRRKHGSDLQLLDEFRAAGRRNPRAFIEKKLHIRTKAARLELLQFNESQCKLWEYREKCLAQSMPFYPLILKRRQNGTSTWGNGVIFEESYCNDNIDALIVAHLKERAEALFEMQHLFLKCLPTELQMPLSKAGKGVLKWDHNNSKISIATAGTSAAGRGGTVQRALLSEAAFYPNLLLLLGALEQAIPELPDSMLIMESTANGTGNEFHALWKAANTGKWIGDEWIRGDVRYIPIFLEWFKDAECMVPLASDRTYAALLDQAFSQYPELKERQAHYNLSTRHLLWYWNTLVDKCHGDELLMQQEYPCDPDEAFISSGQPIFPMQLTGEYRQLTRPGKLYDPTISDWSRGFAGLVPAEDLKRNADTYLEIWEEPKASKHYLISADGAEGMEGRDYSVAYIFDMVSMNIVGELHGHIEPGEFARLLAKLGTLYNRAVVAPETHGAGVAVLSALKDCYWNIYQWRKMDQYGLKITNSLGWDTNIQSRQVMIAEARRMYRERRGDAQFIPSQALIDEIKTFVISNLAMKPVAASGCHDDRVMAWMIGVITCLQEVGSMPNTGLITTSDSRISPQARRDTTDLIDLISNPKWTGQSFDTFYGSND